MLDTPPELHADIIAATATTLLAEQSVVILYLLRYRDQTADGESPTQPPRTSQQAFQTYIEAFLQHNDPAGFKILFQGTTQAQLAGSPGEQWDAIALVKYRNLGVFRRWVESDFYISQVAPFRRAALADWRQLLLTGPSIPNETDIGTSYLHGLMAQEIVF